ncbi:MAG: hypothetical protein JW730_09160 [Anaerolineales bacterium]|nr:hypothetical protein [Anaerolineales bacterium]
MNTNRLILIVLVSVVGLMQAACGAGQVATPTFTPLPSQTPLLPTATLTATLTPVPPTSTPESDKQIKLIYMEGDKPTANKTIWFSFYDESANEWVTSSGVTDQDGMAIFDVPEGKEGESYTFTFAYSEEDVNKIASQITDGTRNGLRIPPDFSQKSLTLKLYGMDVSVEDGAIQLWQPK